MKKKKFPHGIPKQLSEITGVTVSVISHFTHLSAANARLILEVIEVLERSGENAAFDLLSELRKKKADDTIR